MKDDLCNKINSTFNTLIRNELDELNEYKNKFNKINGKNDLKLINEDLDLSPISNDNENEVRKIRKNSSVFSLNYSSSSASTLSNLTTNSFSIRLDDNFNNFKSNEINQTNFDKKTYYLSEDEISNLDYNNQAKKIIQNNNSDLNSINENVDTNSFQGLKENPFIKKDAKKLSLFKTAKEIVQTEENYVKSIELICVHYKEYVQDNLPKEILDQLLQPYHLILNLNTLLLKDFQQCLECWHIKHKIAHKFAYLGPFLKHYGEFATKYDTIKLQFEQIKKKYPAFKTATEQFEQQPICKKLIIEHYMIKPIQRIAQYKLLFENYFKCIKDDPTHPDYKDAQKAISIIKEVLDYSNSKMKESDNFYLLLGIQQRLKNYEIIKPHRRLIKKGILLKISRKGKQERLFVLCTDCLIYLRVINDDFYTLNHEMSLVGMRINSSDQENYKNEILIHSSHRSILVEASSLAEKQGWMDALNSQINKQNKKLLNLCNQQTKKIKLGSEAPIWIPDERVSMCQICTFEFTLSRRRHHCRACGGIICNKCSFNKFFLPYLNEKGRVCDNCFETLNKSIQINEFSILSTSPISVSSENLNSELNQLSLTFFSNITNKIIRNSSLLSTNEASKSVSNFYIQDSDTLDSLDLNESLTKTNLDNSFQIENCVNNFDKINRAIIGQSGRRSKVPKVLIEVSANDKQSDMSGYMLKRKNKKKWKQYWFVLKNHVLYSFKKCEDKMAIQSLPILGYKINTLTKSLDGYSANLILQLTHENQPNLDIRKKNENLPDMFFKVDDEEHFKKWFEAFTNATDV